MSQLEIAQPITWLGFIMFFMAIPLAIGYLYSSFWARILPWMLATVLSVICMLAGQEISEQAPGWVVNPFPILTVFSARVMPISILFYLVGLAIRWTIGRLRKPAASQQRR